MRPPSPMEQFSNSRAASAWRAYHRARGRRHHRERQRQQHSLRLHHPTGACQIGQRQFRGRSGHLDGHRRHRRQPRHHQGQRRHAGAVRRPPTTTSPAASLNGGILTIGNTSQAIGTGTLTLAGTPTSNVANLTVANPIAFSPNANVTFDGSNSITFSSTAAMPLSVTSENLTGTTITVTNPGNDVRRRPYGDGALDRGRYLVFCGLMPPTVTRAPPPSMAAR